MSGRVVLDTNVLVSALFWDGNERRVLVECIDGDRQLVISPFVLQELQEVLAGKFEVPDRRLDTYVRTLLVHAELVGPELEVDITRDDADDRILALGLAADADLLVTGDGELLELGSWQGIRICSAGDVV